MKNFKQPGHMIRVSAPYAVASGAGVLVGALFGVAAGDADLAEEVEIGTCGVYELAAASGGSSAIAVGAQVYWDDTAKVVTGTVGSNTLIGVAVSAKTDAAAVVDVRLNGSF